MSIVPSIFKGEISGKWKEGDDTLDGCRHEPGKNHRDVPFALERRELFLVMDNAKYNHGELFKEHLEKIRQERGINKV